MYARIYVKAETYIRKKPRRVSQRSGAFGFKFHVSGFNSSTRQLVNLLTRYLPHNSSGMSTDGGDECRQHCNHDVNDALQRPLSGFCHIFLLSFCGSLILIFFNFLIFQLNPSEGSRPSTRFRWPFKAPALPLRLLLRLHLPAASNQRWSDLPWWP